MRAAKPLIGIVLGVSVLLNAVLIVKIRGRRAVMQVDGVSVSRNDMNRALELEFGPQYKANLVARVLLSKEAVKHRVEPTDAEINEQFEFQKELDWAYAQRLMRAPWLAEEAKAEIKMQIEENRLLTEGIEVSDDEIRTEYQQNHSQYDTPTKAKCAVAVVLTDSRIEDVRRMLVSQNPPYSPAKIMENYPREVVFLGDNYRFTFAQPFGTDYNSALFKMELKTVKVENPPADLARQGARKVLIRVDEIVPGHRADLTDPAVLKKIKINVARRRARPSSELMSELWQKANLVFDDPADKTNIERVLFPDKANSDAK
jgi:hypothetical protein